MVTQNYTISTVKNAVPPRVKMSQYDTGSRTITFSVVDGSGSAVDLTGKTVTVEGTRIDGHAFAEPCTVSEDTATFVDTVDMTNAAGDHPAELVVRQNEERLGTMNFIISVEPAAMDEDASIDPEDQSLFEQLYAKVASGSPVAVDTVAEMTNTDGVYLYTGDETGYTRGYWYYYNGSAWVAGGAYGSGATDKTLTLSDVAADAKVVGDRLDYITDYVLESYITDLADGWGSVGLTFSKVSDTQVAIYGTATATRRFNICNGKHIVMSTSSAFNEILPAGKYRFSVNSDATLEANAVRLQVTTNTYASGVVGTVSIGDPQIFDCDSPIMFGLFVQSGTNLGTEDDPTIVTLRIESITAKDEVARRIDTTLTLAGVAADAKATGDAIALLTNGKKYGVSGIGQSASALTRLWDSVGMVAQVGTDGDNSNVANDFDTAAPFMRRKCVGKWYLINGKTVFRPNAYYGDTDYTEDGSMGDYVAVECPRAYYYLKDGVLGVSDRQYPGWRPFDIFCVDHNPQDTIPYAYLPAYALALKDGKAVSLPGLDNFQGCYKDVIDACRTYDGDAGAYAFSQPWAVNFYEWALFTVEFATQNCQGVMQGCASLRHSADDSATLRADGKWLLSNYQAARVVGECISIQPTNVDINSATYYASHKITSITRCDASGNTSSSGAYQLIETEDLGLEREYIVGESYRIVARPWRTGTCNGVSTPSGSPVSNTNGYFPMRYRWRENVYSNQHKTIADLFNKIVAIDSSYMLEWYYLPDPAGYTPSATSKPDATDLTTDKFVLLDIETPVSNYANGYIKSKQYSEELPDVWIPLVTTGAGASSYYCDYAYLVYSHAVRSVRCGGNWSLGLSDGFSSLLSNSAPSLASATFGGDLFFPQSRGELSA